MTARWLSLALAVGLAAAPGAAHAGCKGRLSGAVTGSFSCEAAVTVAADGRSFFVISPTSTISSVPSYAPGAFELPAAPAVRTYTLESLGMGRASVAAEGGALYTATRTTGQRGEVTLTLTRVERRSGGDGGYLVRGSYRARLLPAAAGRKDEVRVEVDF